MGFVQRKMDPKKIHAPRFWGDLHLSLRLLLLLHIALFLLDWGP